MIHHIAKWNLVLWCVTLTVALFLEFWAIFGGRRADTTLTGLLCWWIPVWLRAMILGWLCWHFLIQHPGRS